MNALPLPGCTPTPLAHYLKALGVLRLLSEQLPPDKPRPRGAWQGETFVLHSSLDRAGLENFFLHEYRPTPILAPWNGGSGFYPGDNRVAVRAIAGSGCARLESYRVALVAARRGLARYFSGVRVRADYRAAVKETANAKERGVAMAKVLQATKSELLLQCRAGWPESMLTWLDAALVLTDAGAKYPPLLGTGGNDGRLEFTNNFMQRIALLMELDDGAPVGGGSELLASSLFGEPARGLRDDAIGQFHPHAAGGLNATTGFDAGSHVNPWDFVLALEGALLFPSAAVRRLETEEAGQMAFPFCIRPSGSGYASGAESDASSRGEFWVPLWERAATVAELRHVFAEGRARLRQRGVRDDCVDQRGARDGFEFARAISVLGVDRGLTAFQRYGFAQRNGLAYFATPLDRFPVRRRPADTTLLDELDRDGWLDRLRQEARKDRAPARVVSAVRAVEQAALALLHGSQVDAEERRAVEGLLMAVAGAETALAKSLRWSTEHRVPPVPTLHASRWWECLCRRTDPELDLAAGLASLGRPGLRVHWEPLVVEAPYVRMNWDPRSREVVWDEARLEATLLALHRRRILLEPGHSQAFHVTYGVRPASIAAFLARRTDDREIARLARALSLVRLPEDARAGASGEDSVSFQDAGLDLAVLFALPRLALAGRVPGRNQALTRLAGILRHGEAENGGAVTRLSAQRLRASGFTPVVREVSVRGADVRRAVAATLFPLHPPVLDVLAERLRPLRLRPE